LEDVLHVSGACEVTIKLVPELSSSALKARSERVDVVLGSRLVDSHSDQCRIETVAELVGVPFESLKYGADLTIGARVRLTLRLCAYSDD
jgi:hypothetical protein